MLETQTAQEVFDQWERDGKGDRMAESHWPYVYPVLSKMAGSTGNYLEIGVGTGRALEYIAKNAFKEGHCYGLDVSIEMVNKCRERFAEYNNVSVENADFLKWTPPEKHFNVIFSMEVFYYLPDIQAGLNRVYEFLGEDGEIWVLVNFYQENTMCHSWPEELGTPMQLWSKDQYIDGFRRAGFSDIKQELIGDLECKDGVTLCTHGHKKSTVR